MRSREELREGNLLRARERANLDLGLYKRKSVSASLASKIDNRTHRIIHEPLDHTIIRRAKDPKNLIQLIIVISSPEKRHAADHLCHDAACGPDVDRGRVGSRAEEDIWRAVPERYYFV